MAGSQGYIQLVEEIGRVVKSPYPTQLKRLHTIICQQCSDLDISHWASARPCQIDGLAQNVLEAVQQWPYVLEIISRLCSEVSVRDALLRRHPILLFEAVSQAVTGSWQHNSAAIAMLSHPLPEDVTLPAASQTLFLGIVDHAVQSPSSLSIKPVYLLLQGGLAPLLGLLPNGTLNQMETQFMNILRSTIGQEDQCLSLYCLAIMKAMVVAADDDISLSSTSLYQTQELLMSTPNTSRWKPKGMQQYFAGGKAHKTLHLIALRVIWASRVTAENAADETSEVLALSTEIIKFLPEEVRKSWCSENPILVRKLQDRANQSDLDVHVQLQALAFISNLCKSQRLPDEMGRNLARILLEPTNLTIDLADGDQPSIACFAGMLTSGQVTDIVSSITSFIINGSRQDIVSASHAVPRVVAIISGALSTSEIIVNGTITALSSSGVAGDLTRLRHLLQNTLATTHETEDGICDTLVERARRILAAVLCGLFLRAALLADHTQSDLAFDLHSLLIEVHALSASVSSPCSHAVPGPQPHIIARLARRSDSISNTKDWRQAIDHHLHSRMQSDRDQLSKYFSNACANLEDRCSSIEAPLREELDKRAQLQQQYDALSRSFTDLEDEKSRIANRIHTTEAERAALSEELEGTRSENDELLSRIDGLESRLRQTTMEAERQLITLKTSTEMTEMEQATTIAKQEEHLDELQSNLASLQIENQSRGKLTEELRQDLEAVRRSNHALEADITRYRRASEEQSQFIASAERAKHELDGKCAGLLADLQALQDQLASEKQNHETSLSHVRQEADCAIVSLQRDKEESERAIRQQHQRDLDQVTQKLVENHDESRRAQEEHSAQVAKRDKKLTDLVKKVDHLKTVCSDKDDQIAEANAMRTNLMAAMGLGNMRTQGSQPANRRVTRSTTVRDEADDNTDVSLSVIDALASLRSSAIPRRPDYATNDSQGDPSPKRAKPRKSVVAVSPARARVSTASRSTRNSLQGRSTTMRQPLLAISGNKTPSRGGAKTPCPSAKKGVEVAFDETTFDGSEIFASTPGVGQRQVEMLPDDESAILE